MSIPTVHLVSKIEPYGSLVLALSDFAWRHWDVVALENGPQNFSDDVLDFGIQSINQSAKLN